MPWIRFTHDYDFKPTRAVTIAYKAGMVQFVTTPCATLAVAAGKAVRLRRNSKYDEPVEADQEAVTDANEE